MQRRRFLKGITAGSIPVTAGLAGCTGTQGSGESTETQSDSGGGSGSSTGTTMGSSGSDTKTVTIGVVGPKSGPLSKLWSFYEKNIQLAIDQINGDGNFVHDGGGLDVGGETYEVDYVAYDTESKPNVGVSAAERAIDQDGVPVLLGAMSSTTTLAIMEVTKESEIPQITSVSVNEKITGEAWHKWMFRNKDTDAIRAKWITKAIADEMDIGSVGMIGPNNDFGVGRMQTFANRLGDRGIDTVTQQTVNPDQQSFLTELQKIKSKGPDALYLVINDPTHAELMIPEARQVGFETIIGTGPCGVPDMPDRVGDALDDVYVEVTFPNDAKGSADHVSTWAQNLEQFTNGNVRPNYIGAPTYDAVNVIADSIVRAESTAPGDVRTAMTKADMKGVFPYPDFRLQFGEHNQAQVVSGLGQWQSENDWQLAVQTGPFAEN